MTASQQSPSALRRLDIVSFDELLRRSLPFDARRCVLDLRDISLFTPTGLVCLAVLCKAVHERGQAKGRWPTIELGGELQRSYLARAGLLQVVDRIASINPHLSKIRLMRGSNQRGASAKLIEVTSLGDPASLFHLLERVRIFALSQLKYDRRSANLLTQAVSEACSNVDSHNGRDCGFFCLQQYHTGRAMWVEMGIADCGEGIAETLRRNPTFTRVDNDMEALRAAINNRVSQYQDETRGTGLYHLIRVARQLEGVVHVRTGSARGRFDALSPGGVFAAVPWMPGVQISLVLRAA